MPISTPDDHELEGGIVRLQLCSSLDQVLMAFNIGEPPDRSDDQRIRWTAEPIRLLFPLDSCLDELLPIDSARHHGKSVGRADLSIEVILPFRFRQCNHSIRECTQHPFDLKKQPGSEWTEMAVEHMAVRRMDNDRHPRKPGCHSPQHSGLRCMGMDQCRPLSPEQANQLPQGLHILDRMDLSRQRRKQHPADGGLLKSPTILLSRCLPALRIPTTWMPGYHQRLEQCSVMAENRQHRVLRRPATVEARDHMDHLPCLRSLSVLRQAHEQTIQIGRMSPPIIAPFHDLPTFL